MKKAHQPNTTRNLKSQLCLVLLVFRIQTLLLLLLLVRNMPYNQMPGEGGTVVTPKVTPPAERGRPSKSRPRKIAAFDDDDDDSFNVDEGEEGEQEEQGDDSTGIPWVPQVAQPTLFSAVHPFNRPIMGKPWVPLEVLPTLFCRTPLQKTDFQS